MGKGDAAIESHTHIGSHTHTHSHSPAYVYHLAVCDRLRRASPYVHPLAPEADESQRDGGGLM